MPANFQSLLAYVVNSRTANTISQTNKRKKQRERRTEKEREKVRGEKCTQHLRNSTQSCGLIYMCVCVCVCTDVCICTHMHIQTCTSDVYWCPQIDAIKWVAADIQTLFCHISIVCAALPPYTKEHLAVKWLYCSSQCQVPMQFFFTLLWLSFLWLKSCPFEENGPHFINVKKSLGS